MDITVIPLNRADRPLGIGRQPDGLYYGLTLNFPVKRKFRLRNARYRWSELNSRQQRDIYIEYIKKVFTMCQTVYLTFEFTAKCELHCHALLYLKDKAGLYDYHLKNIRAYLNQSPYVRRMVGSRVIVSNYIHKLQDIDLWVEYMDKCYNNVPWTWIKVTFERILEERSGP